MHLGIEELRRAVCLFNNCNEGFNQQFGAEQLIIIYRAYKACGWDITPDRWEWWQVRDALMGLVPQWDNRQKPTASKEPDVKA